MKLITRGGYFRLGPNKDGRLDSDTIHTISNIALVNHKQLGKISNVLVYLLVAFFLSQVCFRELCALCWMLHVRDQLSLHCRRYQAARQRGGDEEVSHTV